MSYVDIFIIGWNLNAMMFMMNLIIAFGTIKDNDPVVLHKESQILKDLKEEFDNFYPNRKYDVLITYLFPFMAFFRTSFRMFEMVMFFRANQGSKMFDFMVYKYQTDINRVKRS